jgi:hypothetical protein
MAKVYLFLPVVLILSLTKGPVDKPAKTLSFKFPGSAILSPLNRTS